MGSSKYDESICMLECVSLAVEGGRTVLWMVALAIRGLHGGCWAMCARGHGCFVSCGFQKYRVMETQSTPHHRHHLHPAQTLTEQKQWESRGRSNMSAVGCDPYLFLWVLQAASHRQVTHRCAVRSLNTDSLCSHSSAWEEPCATHHTMSSR